MLLRIGQILNHFCELATRIKSELPYLLKEEQTAKGEYRRLSAPRGEGANRRPHDDHRLQALQGQLLLS